MEYKNQLSDINDELDSLLNEFENKYSMGKIVNTVKEIPNELREKSINQYQRIIRNNHWFFPSIRESVSLEQFLERWKEVHKCYISLSEKVFEQYSENGCSIDCLASKELLKDVIQSETMRGWVGKRSPMGLDALLRQREEQFTKCNKEIAQEDIDCILDYLGLYHDDNFLSAEHELLVEMTSKQYSDYRNKVLRYFCQYNLDSLAAKEEALKECHNSIYECDYVFDKPLNEEWLLEEIRALNYLNLNLEVKYSFKGFPGLMHVLVFYACKKMTETENVYEMLLRLD